MDATTDILERYRGQTPYAALGIEATDSDARHVRDTFYGVLRDLQEQNLPPEVRVMRSQELEAAYDLLRDPADRVKVDFFLLDRNLGRKQCEASAAGVPKPNTDITCVVKPRNIRVTHEVLYDQLALYFTDPPKVGGLFPAPMEIGSPEIPDILDIAFDC